MKRLALGGFAPLLLLSAGAHANGAFETYGADARGRGMAHADVALPGVAAAHNSPAALALSDSTLAVSVAYSLDVPALQLALDAPRDAGDPLAPAQPPAVSALNLAFTLPVDLVGEDRLFVGAAAYFPTSVLVRARAFDPQRPFFAMYDSATEHYDVSVGAGLRAFDVLHVGAGLRLAAGQSGDVRLAVDPVRGRIVEQSADTFQYPTFAPTAGLVVGPLGVEGVLRGSAAVVWREPTSFDVTLPASLVIEGADINAVLDVLILANYEPRSLTGGVSFEVRTDLVVDIEAQWAMWSAAPPPAVITEVDLGGGGLEALGLEGALDAPTAGQDRVQAPGYVDTLVWRVGAEWRALEPLTLRAGYQYRPSPVPDQTSGTNIVDANVHIVALGLAVPFRMPQVFNQPLTAELGYQAQLLEARTAVKASPLDEIGDWTASGVVHALALGWTYRF
ncbi:MAG: outer membrane protein transport protein, partial [Deltaproteobacteria bacterium]|nr:outer membrane protein transport protein [Deltaproteobacteria bacterium]